MAEVLLPLGSVLVSFFGGLLLSEGVLRLKHGPLPGRSPLYRLTEAPHRFELVPNLRAFQGKIDTDSRGLRGLNPGPRRDRSPRTVLFVGDSVTFAGEYINRVNFVAKLPALLAGAAPGTEETVVYNGGVPGYTPFNELSWLKHHGPSLRPNLVVIQFCANDIVDPLPHWQMFLGTGFDDARVPRAAIPDHAYHRRLMLVQPLRHFRLYWYFNSLGSRATGVSDAMPSSLTREDGLTIDAYSAADSPRVRWLEDMYRQLIAEARHLGAEVLILIVPLAYQLDAGYPNQDPQTRMLRIAQQNGVRALDLTPAFRAVGARRSFRLDEDRRLRDVWHLNPEGHDIAARELARAIHEMRASSTQ
jgi:lysophospholipase L1-like esterase